MKFKILKCAAVILAMICILCFPIGVSASSQGTEGTELEVIQPQNLEIRLGQSWAGAQFELETDAGMYPGVIAADQDGVLRLEIGGSEHYLLSCVNASAVTENVPAGAYAEPASESSVGSVPSETESNAEDVPRDPISEEVKEEPLPDMPPLHIILFGCGLIVAISILVGVHFCQKRRGDSDEENDI